MKVIRKIIEIDEEKCDGCGNCVPSCAEGAIQIIDGKAKVIGDKYCDGLGACLGDCPKDALKLIERQADEYDEEAVHARLERQKTESGNQKPKGCPSQQVKTFPISAGPGMGMSTVGPAGNSALGHWPVQLRLIPSSAPFLKDANLLITADCVPVAAPSFHSDYLKGKVVMLACPKFDDDDLYIDKLADIFSRNNIKGITMMVMEVPCCSKMKWIVDSAMEKSGENIPVHQVTISTTGQPLP
ncbi:4Fe-4S dicluster domain-containing protein [uncultured Desulfobacter sp.]|uniref:ATP-binding protein n=1 Tax=uncultured Desulfobacter sp. TaxID=240139 RepID=UPI002AA8E021|nr:4Fe-4S dicluster domain-containing protein [uncultured Desulfobacter sp.]